MIRPFVDLASLYGEGHVYSGFIHPGLARWLPCDPDVTRSLTASQLSVFGQMPVICARGGADERGLDLLREAGLELAPQRLLFDSLAEYEAILRGLVGEGRRLVLQHRHPAELVPDAACWVAPDLLATLNDKGDLGAFVGPFHLPERTVFAPGDAAAWAAAASRLPCVFKAATRQSTGGGGDVFMCRERGELNAIRRAWCDDDRVVAEEWLGHGRSYCLNYAVDVLGRPTYLGGAEIVCTEDGRYRGNWLDETGGPADESVAAATETVRRAARLGYRGVLGIDLMEVPGRGARIFDLNFRFCGSTVALLNWPAIRAARGCRVARLGSFVFAGGYAEMIASARQAVRAGYFFPFSSYHPGMSRGSDILPRMSGMLLGNGRREVARSEARMRAAGWH